MVTAVGPAVFEKEVPAFFCSGQLHLGKYFIPCQGVDLVNAEILKILDTRQLDITFFSISA